MKGLTDEQVEQEIEKLQGSPLVKLARKEERIRYVRRQYLYTLRQYEKKGKELAKNITEKGHRGATIIEGEGGYTGEVSELVICVARSHEIPHIKRMCKEIDPEAFIVMSEANEILGYGFNPPALDD